LPRSGYAVARNDGGVHLKMKKEADAVMQANMPGGAATQQRMAERLFLAQRQFMIFPHVLLQKTDHFIHGLTSDGNVPIKTNSLPLVTLAMGKTKQRLVHLALLDPIINITLGMDDQQKS
jgi:hypothetical protein